VRQVGKNRQTDGPSASAASYLRQDPLDGGKALGMSRREQGRFGSLPLYDGYDEESSP